MAKGVKILDKLATMIERLDAFLDKAEQREDALEFRAVASEWRKQLELIAKLQGELAQEGTVTIINNPEWLQIEATIVATLERFPEAKAAVVGALKELPEGMPNGSA